MNVDRISMCDYEQHHYDKELLKQAGLCHFSVTHYTQIMRMICLYHFYSIFLLGIGNFKSVGNTGWADGFLASLGREMSLSSRDRDCRSSRSTVLVTVF